MVPITNFDFSVLEAHKNLNTSTACALASNNNKDISLEFDDSEAKKSIIDFESIKQSVISLPISPQLLRNLATEHDNTLINQMLPRFDLQNHASKLEGYCQADFRMIEALKSKETLLNKLNNDLGSFYKERLTVRKL